MPILLWIFVPGFTAAGAALLICFMMRCRMDEAIARERGALAELQSALVVQRETLENAISDAKAEAKRAAFDEFLDDFRVERRQYVRKSRLFFMNRQTLVCASASCSATCRSPTGWSTASHWRKISARHTRPRASRWKLS